MRYSRLTLSTESTAAALADESTQVLRETGANHVASTLMETRGYLGGLVEIPRIPAPEAAGVDAA